MDKTKKAIVVTYYKGFNFGSRLQATAMRQVLHGFGYDASFLNDFFVPQVFFRHPRLVFPRVNRKLRVVQRRRFFMPSDYVAPPERMERLGAFLAEYTPDVSVRSMSQWNDIVSDNTVFIAGSDITWQPVSGYPGYFFLDYALAENLPCFSYAASFGTLSLPKAYYGAYRRLLGQYIAVGVREKSSIAMLQPIIDGNVEQVADPTLLLARQEWHAFSQKAELTVNPSSGGYILCYFVMEDPRYWQYVAKMHCCTGLQVIVLPFHNLDLMQPYSIENYATPIEFTYLIEGASMICTDSFHACTLSAIFNKDVYLLRRKRKAEDSKFDDLLKRYGLESYNVVDEESFSKTREPNWDSVNSMIEEDRIRSLDFLKRCLVETGN